MKVLSCKQNWKRSKSKDTFADWMNVQKFEYAQSGSIDDFTAWLTEKYDYIESMPKKLSANAVNNDTEVTVKDVTFGSALVVITALVVILSASKMIFKD